MPAASRLGNDVVDLGDRANLSSAANPRYLDRVLHPRERRRLRGRAQAERGFLAYWAAKEAAFKALSRTAPGLAFRHRRFVVHEHNAVPGFGADGLAQGWVDHADARIRVEWRWTSSWVHCCVPADDARNVARVAVVADLLAAPARDCATGDRGLPAESRAARILACDLLRSEGITEARIRSPGRAGRRGPPVVVCDGGDRSDLRLSLSHDGRFAAALLAVGVSPAPT